MNTFLINLQADGEQYEIVVVDNKTGKGMEQAKKMIKNRFKSYEFTVTQLKGSGVAMVKKVSK